jgi:hypothetical protein
VSSTFRVVRTKELAAKLPFEGADLARERRLGDVQALRRTAEVQLLGDRQEVAQMSKLELHGLRPKG